MTTMTRYPTAEELARSLGGRRNAKGWMARCPAHEDRHASLSISESSDGTRVLWKCHAKCPQDDVKRALIRGGWWPEDMATMELFQPTRPAVKPVTNRKAVATYQYRDAGGTVVHETLRYEPKDFRQRAVLPDGSHEWSLAKVFTVLSRLPDLLASTGPVWIVEGEKDADNLAATGAIATTVPMGAGKWKAHYGDWLRGREVRIVPDNDDAGRSGARIIAKALAGIATSVVVVTLPVEGKGADVSDYLAGGATLADLDALVADASATEAIAVIDDAPDATAIDHQPLTDLGNAERLIARHGLNLRYAHAWKSWLLWDGMRWQRDATGGVMRLAAETIRELTNVASAERSPDMPSARRTALVKHAERSESRQRLEACLALAQNLPDVGILPDALDRDWWSLNVATGTVDLRSCTLAPHRREDYITRIVAYKGKPLAWLPGVRPPLTRFYAFLKRVQPDAATRVFIQRALGYSITGSTRERRLFVSHGGGRNGKTTLLELIRDIVEGYSQVLPSDILMAKKHASGAGGASPDIASLHGARFVLCAETDQGGRLNEGRVKWVTGDDTVQARRLYEAPFTFTPSHTIWLTTNHRPTVRDGGEALWDRLILIPFDVRIPDDEQDKALPEALRAEAEGILAWLIEGAHGWHRDGLNPPGNVLAATDSYRVDNDWFAEFIDSACEVRDGLQVPSADLHRAYAAWAAASSERPLTPTALGILLRERGFIAAKATGGKRVWTGIRLARDVMDLDG